MSHQISMKSCNDFAEVTRRNQKVESRTGRKKSDSNESERWSENLRSAIMDDMIILIPNGSFWQITLLTLLKFKLHFFSTILILDDFK